MPREDIASIKGIGETTAKKVFELLDTGKLQSLEDIVRNTPAGVIEMLQIKGIGPKKIAVIWKEMGIENIGELLYACNENRLTLFKGFGAKTQENIRESISFYMQHQGKFLYAEADMVYPDIRNYLEKCFGKDKVAVTGSFRRQMLTIDALEFVIALPNEKIKPAFQTAQPPELIKESGNELIYRLRNGLCLHLYTNDACIAKRLLLTTGPAAYIERIQKEFSEALESTKDGMDEASFCDAAGIPWTAPYLRDLEGPNKVSLQVKGSSLIHEASIKGIIHSHSNWSDGTDTIEAMAKACMERGFQYLVISDHSKSAAYAGGLSVEKIREQHQYIDSLNTALRPFRIFKSIECDILGDGSLDYTDDVLSTFDLVIASIHSNLNMNEEKAMMRILRAIENPYTTILGHPTGRLLLSRSGYPLDMGKVIEHCAKHDVVIEINAHPRRLDLDWEWIPRVQQHGVLLSINPDAHAIAGFDDCKYGIRAAQKGGLLTEQNLSSFTLEQLERHLARKKGKL
jgi:DNA polymerase (family 10)